MYTRKDYMSNKVSHHEYYSQFATDAVQMLVKNQIGLNRLLASNDPHLNNIPLSKWDAMHGIIISYSGAMIAKANGGGVSLSDTVCTAKAAARILIEVANDEN
jgi:hypothetical protein